MTISPQQRTRSSSPSGINSVPADASVHLASKAIPHARISRTPTPFGVDLLLPQVGGSARKINHDYTCGQLTELIDVIIEKTRLFVSAVGVPPREVVDKLHKAGLLVMNVPPRPSRTRRSARTRLLSRRAEACRAGRKRPLPCTTMSPRAPQDVLRDRALFPVPGARSPLPRLIYRLGCAHVGGIFALAHLIVRLCSALWACSSLHADARRARVGEGEAEAEAEAEERQRQRQRRSRLGSGCYDPVFMYTVPADLTCCI